MVTTMMMGTAVVITIVVFVVVHDDGNFKYFSKQDPSQCRQSIHTGHSATMAKIANQIL